MRASDDRLPESFRLDRVDLTVAELDRSVAWNRDVLGFEPTGDAPAATGPNPNAPHAGAPDRSVTVGAAGRPIVRLHERPGATPAPRGAISEAIYLQDPDGHGVEVYADRPRSTWPMRGDRIAMTAEPLDAEGLASRARTDGSVPFLEDAPDAVRCSDPSGVPWVVRVRS